MTFLTEREDGHVVTFEAVIKKQIKTLRKQLDESTAKRENADGKSPAEVPVSPRPRVPTEKTDIPLALEHLSLLSRQAANNAGPIFPLPNREVRSLLDVFQRSTGGSPSWF